MGSPPRAGDDLYLLAYGLRGACVAPGARIQWVDLSRFDARALDGTSCVRKFFHSAKTKGSGWTTLEHPDPKTGKVELMTTIAIIHDDMIICVGAYKE